MKKVVSGLAGLVLATGIGVGAASAETNYDRTRLAKQPDVGTVNYDFRGGNRCPAGVVRVFPTSNGILFYSANKDGTIAMKDGKPTEQPWAYFEKSSRNVFVNVDGDGKYDFKQSANKAGPCTVYGNLKKYQVK